MEPSAAQFGHLFSWRHPATVDLSHAAYRYNQNMMEYYTCKSKFYSLGVHFWAPKNPLILAAFCANWAKEKNSLCF